MTAAAGAGAGDRYDVAVLGSGMSGAALAIVLAAQGVRVVMVESGVHPRFAVGESTIPHTSLLSSILAERYGVPELDVIAYPERIAAEVCSTCGVKRGFGYAYHRPGEEHDPAEGLLVGTSSKDETHVFRQDVDAWLTYMAVRRGADLRQATVVDRVEVDGAGVTLGTTGGDELRARYLVDGSGFRSVLARTFSLREAPARFGHHSRSLFTHMVDVGTFAPDTPMSIPWAQTTLHHVFDRGWFWVIPFDNREGSTNPLVSVGLTVDPRVHPKPAGVAPEAEFRAFLDRFPSVARQFAGARAVRPWVSTDRLQYSTTRGVGERWCLMSHAYGAIDPLFSRGLVNTLEVTAALVPTLLDALDDDDFSVERFTHVDALHRRVLDYNDRLVAGSFASWADFDLWNAWLRVWGLGTIPVEFRMMNALADYTATHDPRHLTGPVADPVFSDFEDPDYGAYFAEAVALMDGFRSGRSPAGETAAALFDLGTRYEIPLPMRGDGLHRAGWIPADDAMSERSMAFAREGFRWALTNPGTHDLFGTTTTFYRWRARRSDPHLAVAGRARG